MSEINATRLYSFPMLKPSENVKRITTFSLAKGEKTIRITTEWLGEPGDHLVTYLEGFTDGLITCRDFWIEHGIANATRRHDAKVRKAQRRCRREPIEEVF